MGAEYSEREAIMEIDKMKLLEGELCSCGSHRLTISDDWFVQCKDCSEECSAAYLLVDEIGRLVGVIAKIKLESKSGEQSSANDYMALERINKLCHKILATERYKDVRPLKYI